MSFFFLESFLPLNCFLRVLVSKEKSTWVHFGREPFESIVISYAQLLFNFKTIETPDNFNYSEKHFQKLQVAQ